MEDSSKLDKFISETVLTSKYSQINILYNEYINTTNIKWNSKVVFPFEIDADDNEKYTKEDFVCESDINTLLRNMITTYVSFETKITVINSLASENIMRQNSTSESLKKIDEIETNKMLKERKEKKEKEFQKLVESYSKLQFRKA